MSDESSSSTESLPLHVPSSNVSLYVSSCIDFMYMDAVLSLTSILLLLPLMVLVLYLGFQRWKQQRVMSHSDFFTYNSATLELFGLLACFTTVSSNYTTLPLIIFEVRGYIGAFLWFGQMCFPILTCVDRYLAVIHPITYLRLRQGASVRIRNIITVFIWLQGFTGPLFIILLRKIPKYIVIPSTFQMCVFLVIMFFCSFSVLWVLIRPRPGEPGRVRLRVHKSKQRAFCIIVIIMGALFIRFGGVLVCNGLYSSPTVSDRVKCMILVIGGWFSLPSSLMLPLLFLHRAGKLPGCKHNPGPKPS